MAQTPVFPVETWTVQPAFTDAEARNNISGTVCTPSGACLAVNDAKRFGQLFSKTGTTLQPGTIVPLADATDTTQNFHAEGAANDASFFYVVTSRAKNATGGIADTSFLVIRFPVDFTGRPAGDGLAHLQVSVKIRDALAAGIGIPQIPGQQLTSAASDIEGIAVKGRVIHLGFRAPVLSGRAFLVSVPVQAVFGAEPLNPTVRPLALGPDVGIHDLAAVSDGVMILAGPTRDLAGRGSLFHLNDSTNLLKPIAELSEPFDRRPEGLLMLQEDPEFFGLLVLFDGTTNGGPLQYSVPR